MAEPTVNDKSTVNLVLLLVGVATLVSIVGVIWLRLVGKDVSDIMPVVTLGLGALAGLLANTKSIDVGGLQELDDANKAGLDQSEAAAALHAQLTAPKGDFNPPEYADDTALDGGVPADPDQQGEQLV